MAETTPRPSAAERATEFAINAYRTFQKADEEYRGFLAKYEDARLELQWAMAHPALPQGFDPREVVEQEQAKPAEAEKPATKRRGRPPKKTAEAAAPTPAADPAPQVSTPEPTPAPSAPTPEPVPEPTPPAPQPQAAVEPPAQTFAPPAAPAPSSDFFDPFASAN